MKRLLCCVLAVLMALAFLPVGASARQVADTRTIYLDDGAYIAVTLQDNGTRASGTWSGSKTYDYYDSDGVKSWTATLNGTFTYNGSSATCTSSSCSVSISNSAWYVISKSAGKSANTATASVNMGKKLLGITVSKVPVSLSLSCDADGNLS